MDATAFRSHFPVLGRIAYLNAGTDGPIPRQAAEQAAAEFASQVTDGRVFEHFMRRHELLDELRASYATVLHADVSEVALTTSTTEGLGTVLQGIGAGEGDEIVTSDSEHPGVIGPLLVAKSRGATVRPV